MGRNSMEEEAWDALIIPPLGVLFGMMLILMGMDGGSMFFVLAAVTILLLIYLPKLIRGGLGRYGGGAAIRSFFAVMTLVSLALTSLLGFGWFLIARNPPQLVPKSGEGNCATRIEFHFPGKTRVVHDPYRKLVFCRGAWPPEVRKDPDGTVVAVFPGGAGSVETWWDSAGISESGFRFGGWMGVELGEDEILVTKEGTFDGVDRGRGKTVRGEPIFRPHTRGY